MLGKVFILYGTIVLKIFTVNGHCIDIHSQVVSQGLHYVPGPNTCTLCICDKGSPKWCKSVLCSPPQNCKSFQVGNSCCEFKCLDDILTANDGYKETYDFALRVIASAITAILTLSAIFFVFHRLRRRKGRVHQNRQLNEDQRSLNSIGYITGNLGYIPGNIGYLGSGNSELEYHYEETSAHYSLWKPAGNYFPRGEAPPPYEEAVRSAQAENDIVSSQIRTVNNINVVNTNTVNISTRPSQSIQVNVSQQPQISTNILHCTHENLSNHEYGNISVPNVTVHHTNDVNSKNDESIPTVSDITVESDGNRLIQDKNHKQIVHTKSYENILNNSTCERPTTSSETKKSRLATSRDYDRLNIDKNIGKYNQCVSNVFNQKRIGDKTNAPEQSFHAGLYCAANDNVRHRTIPNLPEYQIKDVSLRMKTSKSKDSVHTEMNKRRDFDKLKFGEQSESNLKNLITFRDRKDIPLHRTLPKNLRELTRPFISNSDDEHVKKSESGSLGCRSFPKQLNSYDASQSLGFIKSHISLLDKSTEILPSTAPIRLSILEIKNQDKIKTVDNEEERSFISYQCLSSSQEEDDYRSECENCKSSGFTNVDDDESDVLNETMTLQRRPLESGEEIPYYRTSLTLPTHTKKPRTVTPNPGRESWFVAMQETSSSDESN